jgi:hypothetical protein
MASYGDVLLAKDRYHERKQEDDAYAEYMRDFQDWHAEWSEWGTYGTIIGGLLGFMACGPGCIAAGSMAGKSLADTAYYGLNKDDDLFDYEDLDDIVRAYDDPEFRGKFDEGYESEASEEIYDSGPKFIDLGNKLFANYMNYMKAKSIGKITGKETGATDTSFGGPGAEGGDPSGGGTTPFSQMADEYDVALPFPKARQQVSSFLNKLDIGAPGEGKEFGLQDLDGNWIMRDTMTFDETRGIWVGEHSGMPVGDVTDPGMYSWDASDPDLETWGGLEKDYYYYNRPLTEQFGYRHMDPFSMQNTEFRQFYDEWLLGQDPGLADIIRQSDWYDSVYPTFPGTPD